MMGWEVQSPPFNARHLRDRSLDLYRAGAASPQTAAMNHSRYGVVERQTVSHQDSSQICTELALKFLAAEEDFGHPIGPSRSSVIEV
jgi:hypothetical protein